MQHVIRIFLTCAAFLLVPSCSEPVAVTLMEEVQHSNGLAVQRPDGFDVTEKAGGLALKEQGALRSPRSVLIMLMDKAPATKPRSQRRLANGATASYAVERHSGGSGGDEYELTAWRPANGRWIVLKGWVQTEGGEPGFAVAWAVFDTAQVSGTTK